MRAGELACGIGRCGPVEHRVDGFGQPVGIEERDLAPGGRCVAFEAVGDNRPKVVEQAQQRPPLVGIAPRSCSSCPSSQIDRKALVGKIDCSSERALTASLTRCQLVGIGPWTCRKRLSLAMQSIICSRSRTMLSRDV